MAIKVGNQMHTRLLQNQWRKTWSDSHQLKLHVADQLGCFVCFAFWFFNFAIHSYHPLFLKIDSIYWLKRKMLTLNWELLNLDILFQDTASFLEEISAIGCQYFFICFICYLIGNGERRMCLNCFSEIGKYSREHPLGSSVNIINHNGDKMGMCCNTWTKFWCPIAQGQQDTAGTKC